MPGVASLEQLFSDLLLAQPASPFITYYDESTGERSELSARSLGNWVAKTHFLLIDELGLGSGSTAVISLPANWISIPIALGCLTAGLELGTSFPHPDVAFATRSTATGDAPATYVVADRTAAFGVGAEPLDHGDDYVSAVRPQADKWAMVRFGAGDGDPCLPGLTRGEAAEVARARATELGLEPGARALTTREWHGPDDWLDLLFAPLAVGGSLVYVRDADEDTVARRIEQERVTARI